jgi:glycyl-tRNA synthetase
MLLFMQKIMPHIVEPALGVNRLLLALLSEAMQHEIDPPPIDSSAVTDGVVLHEEGGKLRPLMRLLPSIAPTTVAILPLVKKNGLLDKANAWADELTAMTGVKVDVDAAGSIGTYAVCFCSALSHLSLLNTGWCVLSDYRQAVQAAG